jgi:seryl-tRNA synthetase
MAEAAKAPNVTKKDIQKWLALDAERKRLNREAKALEAQQDELEKSFWDFVTIKEPKSRSVTRSGYVLAIQTAKGQTKWKDEFIKRNGIKVAEEIAEAAPMREYLSVEKVA